MPEQGQMMTKQLARQQLTHWRNMAAARPESADVLQNVATCLFTLGESDEALQLFAKASEMDHKLAALPMNHGMVLKDLGRFSESAIQCFTAYCSDPDTICNGAYYTALGWAESLLRNGNWLDAWPFYNDAMFGTKEGARSQIQAADETPYWRGEALDLSDPDTRLLVMGEGGTGDRINYARWLPELDKRGIPWAYYPDAAPPIPGLLSLFQRVPWLAGKIPQLGYKYSHWTTAFALPAAFNAVPTRIPRYPGWFLPDPELKKKYAIQRPDNLPIYGLIWGANELFEGGMKFRSLLESQAMRLVLSTADMCHWVNCWNGDAHGSNFKLGNPVWNPRFENWEETAALLANVDGVVSTDNGACWLAQALGLRVSVLLSGNSDWKFLRGTEKSYWSERARLFRNGGQGFEDAVTKCVTAIRNGEGVGR